MSGGCCVRRAGVDSTPSSEPPSAMKQLSSSGPSSAGSPIHRGHEVKDFLSRGAAKRLHLEQLPGYAPDLNPDEGIWNYLKRVELGNVCCGDLDQLQRELIRARERLRHKREIIKSCSRQCGYSV